MLSFLPDGQGIGIHSATLPGSLMPEKLGMGLDREGRSHRLYTMMKKSILMICFISLSSGVVKAQFSDATSGLLSIPSAEMYSDGTFQITNLFLNHHNLCPPEDGWHGWEYNTFAYGVGITFWERLEINYVCTLFNGKWSKSGGQPSWFMNQDRHFAAKVLLMKEGDLWPWMPSIAAGLSDPVTGAGGGNYFGQQKIVSGGNGYFNRMYLVFTKHFSTNAGKIGVSMMYQTSLRGDYITPGVSFGVDWAPVWLENDYFSPRIIAEYDNRYVNLGFIANVWENRFEAMFELQNLCWVTFGLRYLLRLR